MPKRVRAPPAAPPDLDPGVSDGENELDPTPLLRPPNRAALVNGRGPLDGFVTQKPLQPPRPARPAPSVTIDLTEDSNSADPTAAAHPHPARDSTTGLEPAATETEGGAKAGADSTPGSPQVSMETEGGAKGGADVSMETPEEGGEVNETDESNNENASLLTPSSTSSLSAVESSPEQAKKDPATPVSTVSTGATPYNV